MRGSLSRARRAACVVLLSLLLTLSVTISGPFFGAVAVSATAAHQAPTADQQVGQSAASQVLVKKKKKKKKKSARKCPKGKKGKKCRAGKRLRHGIVPVNCPIVDPGRLPNPISNDMALYRGPSDPVNYYYDHSSGNNKALLGKIALTPRVMWFGPNITADRLPALISEYIRTSQQGNPNKAIQLAFFGLFPRGEVNRHIPLTEAEVATYRHWVDTAVASIGRTKAIIILEPDLAVNFTGANSALKAQLATYAAQRFATNPNATIYLDGSDSDWLTVGEATSMLIQSGIGYVRGFALGATHYAHNADNMTFGEQVAGMLAGCGYRNKSFVIDTSDTGAPFTWTQHYQRYPNEPFDNARTCTSGGQSMCITLGVRPTTYTGGAHVDAFLWFGRPWLYKQAWPFDLNRALAISTTAPYL